MANPRPSGPRAHLSLGLLLVLLLLPAAFFLARPAAAQDPNCDRAGCGTVRNGSVITCFTPATPPPSSLWSNGQLQPAYSGALPPERDTTNFNELYQNYGSRYWFQGVDVQNGYILVGFAHGIGVWDARTDPANPVLVGHILLPSTSPGTFPFLPSGEQSKIVFGGISAPDDSVAAIAGYNGAGILVFDLSDKTRPRPVYQNADKTGDSVYATKIGTTRYAFYASNSPGGLFVYNLDAALSSNGCLQDSTTPGNCPGVLVKQVSTVVAAGGMVHGAGNYVAISFSGSKGFQVFDMTDPTNPVSKLVGARDRPVQGIAMWNQGSSYYLAARLGATAAVPTPQTAIYDVSCITSANGCSALGSPLSIGTYDTQSSAEYLTFSRSNGVPFLYIGGDAYCIGTDGNQHEWLLNVSNPSAPEDVTPSATTQASAYYNGVITTKSIDYWSYFYRPTPTGFNLVAPRAGKFYGNYFYRTARSIFDIHKWVHDVAPTADFTYSPTEIYPGTPVTFSDRTTGLPTNWSWSFQDGTPASSTAQNPASVTFATAGAKTVALTASNAIPPASTASKSIIVLNPAPQIGSITVSPANPLVCQPVTLTATGVTGQPTLAYSWGVKDSNSTPVTASSSTATLTWATSGLQAGTYTATVTVTNGAGTANKSVPVTLGALSPLAFGPTGAPTNDPFTAGTVQLHAGATGATEWNWDYGDGQGFRGWTSDPVNGPNPSVVYTATGIKHVQVMVRNCVQSAITSGTLDVNITQTTPLVASFQAALFCQFQQCFADVGQVITFNDSSTGAELWDYDWSHADASAATCNFTDAGHTSPVTTHTYTAAGSYFPCLRVRRGASEQNVLVHGQITVSVSSGGGGGNGGGGGGGGNSPAITVGGLTSTAVNGAVTLAAAALNCTPTDGAWSWSTGGGTISGSATGSSISVSWAAAGLKSITVTNTGCSGAVGTYSVNVTDGSGGGGGGGGGTLAAQFTFTPSSPAPADAVSFDASGSTGSPTDYTWNFGDNSGLVTGKTATHAYTAAGTYVVTLTVSKPSTGCPFAPCVATATATKTVVVGGTPPPPPVTAAFTSNATCINVGGFDQCNAGTGASVTFNATAVDGATYQWDFGDGGTATGVSASHAWPQPGTYFVTLTVTKGTATDSQRRQFVVSGTPVPTTKSVVLPWIAQTRGALVQSSDLYIHNPSANPMTVTLQFRKRGLPESNPPQATKTIAPGATLYVADVLGGLFNRENVAGFISLTVTQGDMAPIITSYNTTFQADGKQFGQTISGIAMNTSASAVAKDGTTPSQQLVGLISNSDRLAYFGVSNPGETPTVYHLRLFDKTGQLIGETSQDLTVSAFGQRQFQSAEIQSTFGVNNQDDYRVEVQTKSGGTLVPYASNLRLSSQDPSFIEAGSSQNSKSYLLGVLSAPGNNSSSWESDLLLSNVGTQPATADVTFLSLGNTATPTTPLHLTLQPGETRRLENVVASQWNISNAIGLLTVSSSSPEGIFPVVQGESYDVSIPNKRFGQSMAAMNDANAASTGQTQYLVGLRQDSNHRTTLWLYNPGTSPGQYDIVYRGLDGSVIGKTQNVGLAAGKLRQISPSQHPLPAAGVQDGFTVQIVVKGGKVLSAAQVVNNDTNDPSYIQGDVR